MMYFYKERFCDHCTPSMQPMIFKVSTKNGKKIVNCICLNCNGYYTLTGSYRDYITNVNCSVGDNKTFDAIKGLLCEC